MARSSNSSSYKCSFCGKTDSQVNRLIAGQEGYICDSCVKICNEIRENDTKNDEKETTNEIPKPINTSLVKMRRRKLYLLQFTITTSGLDRKNSKKMLKFKNPIF